METGALIRDEGGLIAEVRSLRREVEALKRAGYAQEAGAPSPGGLISAASQSKLNGLSNFTPGGGSNAVLLGDATPQAIGTNEVVGRVGSAAVDGIGIAAQSVLGRAASDVEDLTASASQILARLSTGNIGFQDRLTWAADQDVLVSETWPYEEVTGNVTLSESTTLAILNHTSAITVTLPRPTYSGKVYIIADSRGKLNGTNDITFNTSGGSDQINGSTGATSNSYGNAYSIFLFVGWVISGPSARWAARQVSGIIS